jgi:hypothetical protein
LVALGILVPFVLTNCGGRGVGVTTVTTTP